MGCLLTRNKKGHSATLPSGHTPKNQMKTSYCQFQFKGKGGSIKSQSISSKIMINARNYHHNHKCGKAHGWNV